MHTDAFVFLTGKARQRKVVEVNKCIQEVAGRIEFDRQPPLSEVDLYSVRTLAQAIAYFGHMLRQEVVYELCAGIAGNFYIALAAEKDRTRVLKIIRDYMKPDQRIFIGVVSPINPRIESPEEIRDLVLEAAQYIPVDRLGTTDDCGFSPFSDDTSTTRDTAFAKIKARVLGTALAAKMIAGG